MSARDPVCRLEDIVPNNRGVRARARAAWIATPRLDDDSVYAIDNHDPFSGANVLARVSWPISRRAGRGIARLQAHFSLVSAARRGWGSPDTVTVSESRRASYS